MTWAEALEDAFDVIEALDETAEDQNMPEIVRDELQFMYLGLLFLKDETSAPTV